MDLDNPSALNPLIPPDVHHSEADPHVGPGTALADQLGTAASLSHWVAASEQGPPAPPEPPSGRGSLLTCGDVEQNPGTSGGRGSILTCGDVEENPGPPEHTQPVPATEGSSVGHVPPAQSMDVDSLGPSSGLTQDISMLSIALADLPALPGDLFSAGLPVTPAPALGMDLKHLPGVKVP